MNKFLEYHIYLKKRSILGNFYKKFYLYPLLRLLLGKRYIDLGCGIGKMLEFSPKYSIGLDINEHNINYISKRKLNAKLILPNGKLPIEDSSYPSLICDNVIEHIEDPIFLINEIKRVLPKNGLLIIGVPMKKGYLRDPDHKVFYDINKLKKLFCEENKFSLNYYFYLPFPFSFLGKFISQQTLYISLKNNK